MTTTMTVTMTMTMRTMILMLMLVAVTVVVAGVGSGDGGGRGCGSVFCRYFQRCGPLGVQVVSNYEVTAPGFKPFPAREAGEQFDVSTCHVGWSESDTHGMQELFCRSDTQSQNGYGCPKPTSVLTGQEYAEALLNAPVPLAPSAAGPYDGMSSWEAEAATSGSGPAASRT